MSPLFELHARPELDAPVLVIALEGWIDAGFAAATALATIRAQTELDVVATFDADTLLDHRARRPTLHLADGLVTGVTWPAIELTATVDQVGNDVLLLVGAEPDHGWRAFSRAVVDLALEFGVRLVTGLGAYPAPAPHTRPTRVVATAGSPDLAQLVGFVPGRIDVPGGVAAAIEAQATEVGLPAVGLWAQVPHYAAAMPFPAAAAALLDALHRTAGVAFGTGTLLQEATSTRNRLDSLVADSPEHAELVRQLERQVDHEATRTAPAPGPGDGALEAVSGDELAEELERFLREQGPE